MNTKVLMQKIQDGAITLEQLKEVASTIVDKSDKKIVESAILNMEEFGVSEKLLYIILDVEEITEWLENQ